MELDRRTITATTKTARITRTMVPATHTKLTSVVRDHVSPAWNQPTDTVTPITAPISVTADHATNTRLALVIVTPVLELDRQTITATNITVLTTSTAGHVTGTENTSGVSSPAAVWNLQTIIAIITETLTSISGRFRTLLISCPFWVVVCHKVVF